jgi:hypothetical protein
MDKNSDKKNNDKEKEKNVEKVWNDSEVQILKKWGEIASSYRLLHDRAFREFQVKSYGLTIPVIILSTLSGTASFTIQSFPASLQAYVPMVIGGVNICVGIIQTVSQFLRVNELTESHRVASISYGKFSRNIVTELSLPPKERTYNGIDFVQVCRTEMDRLIEQSPIIPMQLLRDFEKNKDFISITKPDVLKISNIVEYKPSNEEKVVELMANIADKVHTIHKNNTKSNVNKIHDMFEKKVNPEKDKTEKIELENDIKNVVNNINLNDFEKEVPEFTIINVDEIADKIVNKRNEELKEIDNNGIVSKMLKKKIDIIKPS